MRPGLPARNCRCALARLRPSASSSCRHLTPALPNQVIAALHANPMIVSTPADALQRQCRRLRNASASINNSDNVIRETSSRAAHSFTIQPSATRLSQAISPVWAGPFIRVLSEGVPQNQW